MSTKKTFAFYFVFMLATSCSLFGDEPIKQISVTPNQAAFQGARTPPGALLIKTAQEAGEFFDAAQLEKLVDQVDFNKQQVLVFAWQGSGQDRLTFEVAESYPEQIFFRFKAGRTRDLRSHTQVFSLRANVSWTAPDGKLGGGGPREFVKVEMQGKLNSQVMAIGGETTGVIVNANKITIELELGNNRQLCAAAQKLHGKLVVVKGTLTTKQSVETGQRWILNVTSLTDGNSTTESEPNAPAKDAVDVKLLVGAWTHSREEDQNFEGKVYRPTGSRKFPPSRFRKKYDFNKDGSGKLLYLHPADRHQMIASQWKVTKNGRIKISAKFEEKPIRESFEVLELTKDILRLK